jgi:hypothetical protein
VNERPKPLAGKTVVRLSPTFVQRLKSQGWRLSAIAPARLAANRLTLPIAKSGPLTIFRNTTVAVETIRVGSVCDRAFTQPTHPVIHHVGGLLLARPGGRLQRIPLDKPAISSNRLLFRDARGTGAQRDGSLGKVQPGMIVNLSDQPTAPNVALKATFWDSSWDGLVEWSAVPAIKSGSFGTVQVLPTATC